jgi:regulator of protease activity HflC (stomatin/prohibitin superfamily)
MGRYTRVAKPGLSLLVPFLHKVAYAVDKRELCFRIDPQEATTADNVKIHLGGNLYVRFTDSFLAAYGAERPIYAVVQLAQSVMRTAVGTYQLDKLFSERAALNTAVKEAMSGPDSAAKWGCEVLRFEVTDLEPTDRRVTDSLNKQSVAERERREMTITAEAQKQKVALESEAYRFQQITKAEGDAAQVKLAADAEAYRVQKEADARAYSTEKQAAAESMRLCALSTALGGSGVDAAHLVLSQQYIGEFGHLAQKGNTLIVPQNLADVAGIIASGAQALQRVRE